MVPRTSYGCHVWSPSHETNNSQGPWWTSYGSHNWHGVTICGSHNWTPSHGTTVGGLCVTGTIMYKLFSHSLRTLDGYGAIGKEAAIVVPPALVVPRN